MHQEHGLACTHDELLCFCSAAVEGEDFNIDGEKS
jgi:hypothetical protein